VKPAEPVEQVNLTDHQRARLAAKMKACTLRHGVKGWMSSADPDSPPKQENTLRVRTNGDIYSVSLIKLPNTPERNMLLVSHEQATGVFVYGDVSSNGQIELGLRYNPGDPSEPEIGDGVVATARHCINDRIEDWRGTHFRPSLGELTVDWPAQLDREGNITAFYSTEAHPLAYRNGDTADLALLTINPDAPGLNPVSLKIGPVQHEPLASFGHPLEASWTMSATESADRVYDPFSDIYQLQVSFDSHCNVGRGNSGGPLLDSDGHAVGTLWGMSTLDTTVFWALPSTYTHELLQTVRTVNTRKPNLFKRSLSRARREPVERCPAVKQKIMITPQGPQFGIMPDELNCVRVK
jgi:hypothetical protein